MSLAFRLDTHPRGRIDFLIGAAHLCAAFGIGTASLQFLADGRSLAALLTCLALWPLLRSWRAWRRAGARPGSLVVAADGDARWLDSPRAPGSSDRCLPGCGVEPLRWHAFAGIAWIEARIDGKPRSLLLSRARDDHGEWRGLMRWLRWLDRRGRR